jgi:hypothetical protein
VLALYKLRARSWWNTITNGKIKSIQDEPGTFPLSIPYIRKIRR